MAAFHLEPTPRQIRRYRLRVANANGKGFETRLFVRKDGTRQTAPRGLVRPVCLQAVGQAGHKISSEEACEARGKSWATAALPGLAQRPWSPGATPESLKPSGQAESFCSFREASS